MKKIACLISISVVFVSGCTQTLKTEHTHNHGASSNQFYNDKVLNCVGQSGHHVYEEESVCPLGGEKFKSLTLGTHSTFGQHLDWEPVSYMRFPTPIPICPDSGFVISQREYDDVKLKKLKAVVETDQYQQYYKQKHATYFLFAKTLELSGDKTKGQWWLYLNATWEADNCGDEVRYAEYANLVIEESEAKLASLNSESDEYWILNIIIPNMYRRIGNFSKAQEYFNKIGTPNLTDKEATDYFLLAKETLSKAILEQNTGKVAIE